ncbi:PQQ-like beta-propeller repeat protein [Candidatus Cytomitobacter indipagum]|uniref:PQQ-like beta-propeller repeat protein n=1 Tax=Candidatus Cytomitobacter indipagum TaxID=2601575 RepID=A0A5C0UF05_9PROT|nr:PQQ-binding-like beta-propeller repeat protein [Candidatus Cytomitobacter indipagum]QEK38290.1 PQQ-like beta-propeller repeat protein [Candidatus Cytomitobacter indipagum]
MFFTRLGVSFFARSLLCIFLFGCDNSNVNWKALSHEGKSFKKVSRNIVWKEIPRIDLQLPNISYKEKKLYIKNILIDIDLKKNIITKELSDNLYIIGDLSNNFYVVSVKENSYKIEHKGVLGSPLGDAVKAFGRLFVCSTSGNLKAFNQNFDVLWERKKDLAFGMKNSIFVKNDRIIQISYDGDITSLDPVNGEDLWVHMSSNSAESFDLFVSEKNIVSRINQRIISLNMNGNGSEKEFPGLRRVFFDNKNLIYLIFDNEVFVCDLNGVSNREFLNHYKAEGEFFMSNEVLFSLSKDGNLFAYLQNKELVKGMSEKDANCLRSKIAFHNNGRMFVS